MKRWISLAVACVVLLSAVVNRDRVSVAGFATGLDAVEGEEVRDLGLYPGDRPLGDLDPPSVLVDVVLDGVGRKRVRIPWDQFLDLPEGARVEVTWWRDRLTGIEYDMRVSER